MKTPKKKPADNPSAVDMGVDDIPPYLIARWQGAADLLAELLDVPAALVMRTENEFMEVAVSSQTEGNPYRPGDKEHWEGLYCQTVIREQKELVVVNALKDPHWDHNPDIKLGMVAYLGLPVNFPDGRPYGSICVLDSREHHFTEREIRVLESFRQSIEKDLEAVALQIHADRQGVALKKSEAFIRAIVDNLPVGICVNTLDPDARPEYMNDSFAECYRTTREALTSVEAFWEEAYPDPDVRRRIRERVEADCASGDPDRMYWPDLPVSREGEETTYITARNTPIPGSDHMISLVWDVTDRKKAEEELATQFDLLRVAGEMARFGGWVVDLAANKCIWSDTVADIHEMPHGYAPPVEKGIAFYAPEYRDRVTEVFTACAKEGRSYDEEMQILTRTGKRVWVRTVGEAVRDGQGNITRVRGAFQDISARKGHEEHVEYLNRVLRAIRDVNQLITHEKDRETLLRRACDILISTRGYRSAWAAYCDKDGQVVTAVESGIGEGFQGIRRAIERGEWPECCDLASGSPDGIARISNTDVNCRQCRMPHAHRDNAALAGRLRHGERDYGVLVVALPEGVAGSGEERSLFHELVGDVGYALFAMESEEQRNRAEQELRQTNVILTELLDVARTLTQARGFDDVVSTVRRTARTLSNADGVTVVLREGDQCHYVDEDAIEPLWKGQRFPMASCISGWVMEHGEPVTIKDIYADARVPHATYRPTFVKSLAMAPIRATNPVGAIGLYWKEQHAVSGAEMSLLLALCNMVSSIWDAIEAREALSLSEEQLRQAQKMESIGRLAGGVAHDFNNLLMVIMGCGEMMRDALRADEPLRDDLQQILDAGQRAANLTRQLLAFSRKQSLAPKRLDLNQLVGSLEKMLGRLIGEHITLELVLSGNPARIVADPGQLEQIVMNLAVNARDAMPDGGLLRIQTASVERDGDCIVQLTVTDTGCGMGKQTLEQIFEPFFTTKERGRGTGLGLSTVYGIVKQSGGEIKVYSEPGEGTTFEMLFPQADASIEQSANTANHAVPKSTGEHVLLVEDDASLRGMLERRLTGMGYTVTTAADGAQALRLVEQEGIDPDLVITDLIMPNMNGKDFVDHLRRNRPEQRVLYMSGYVDESVIPNGILGPDAPFIQKPFSAADLARKIREILGHAS